MKSMVVSMMLLIAGCAGQGDIDEAKRQATELRMKLEAAEQQQVNDRADYELFRAQRERYEAENRELKREVAALREHEKDLTRQLAALQSGKGGTPGTMESQRKELDNALIQSRRSRDECERKLADRQRDIEMLTNQVQRLNEQLEALRKKQSALPH